MAQPQAADQVVYSEIIGDLNTLMKSEIAEFDLFRALKNLEGRALDLKRVSKAYGFAALGSISAARGDAKGMHHNHGVSLQYSREAMLVRNYVVSMGKLGLIGEALTYGAEELGRSPGDVALVEILVRIAYDGDRERDFVRYAEMFREMQGQSHPLWKQYEEICSEIHDLNRQCGAATVRAITRSEA